MVEQGKPIPDKVTEYTFVGTQKHDETLNKILEFVEFLIIQSDNRIELGIQNIELLWTMLVTEANFESD
jgi:hypothetical protein